MLLYMLGITMQWELLDTEFSQNNVYTVFCQVSNSLDLLTNSVGAALQNCFQQLVYMGTTK